MPNYYAQVAIASASGESADVSINTFAVGATVDMTSSVAADWQTELVAFYQAVKTVGALSGRDVTGHVTKILKATMTVPNYPLFQYAWSLTGGTASLEMPEEVALCASYSADAYPLVPRARRRGRIYLSGWKESNNDSGRPTTATYEGLATAYADYATAVNAIDTLAPGVWSRSSGDVFLIDRVWCDNEWDTMRSRGGKSTLRKTLPV